MVGAFRFFKQTAGQGYFAEVGVELAPAVPAVVEGEPEVTPEVTFDTDHQSSLPAEWLAAAERGCRDALAALGSVTPLAGQRFNVRIMRLVYTWVDTTADAVYAASYLAVVSAAGMQSRFELYRDTKWRVRTRA